MDEIMILEGKRYEDERGVITYNNEFDFSKIRRLYTIENHSADFIRGWQGHKIEQRWYSCVKGCFEIFVIKIDDFKNPSKDLTIQKYLLKEDALTYLHIPAGHLTTIQAISQKSKLLVLADFKLGEINDEYRFDLNYFRNKKAL